MVSLSKYATMLLVALAGARAAVEVEEDAYPMPAEADHEDGEYPDPAVLGTDADVATTVEPAEEMPLPAPGMPMPAPMPEPMTTEVELPTEAADPIATTAPAVPAPATGGYGCADDPSGEGCGPPTVGPATPRERAPRGPRTGERGTRGPRGPRTEDGARGPRGERGERGERCAAFCITQTLLGVASQLDFQNTLIRCLVPEFLFRVCVVPRVQRSRHWHAQKSGAAVAVHT